MSSSCCGTSNAGSVLGGGWWRLLRDPQTVLTALCGLALVAALISGNVWVAVAGTLFGAYFALNSAWSSLKERSVDVNLLMVIAAVGAIVIGEVLDAAALLFLFSLSSTLESIAMAKTRSAIEGLVKLRPSEAIRISPLGEERVPVELLQVGDRIRIAPFESVPVDSEILQGASQVDQSTMTGESAPVAKRERDPLLAGTQNLEGSLIAEVKVRSGDSTLDKIVELVSDAQENKASGERISQWFGQRYTFFVLGSFLVSLVVRLIFVHEPFHPALLSSLTLLVALSPCALVISTPASTLSALTWAARHGILIRGGSFIEIAGRVDTVVVDKTGTLTISKPRLEEICLCAHEHATVGGRCVDDEKCWRGGASMSPEAARILQAAAASEQYSSHPAAEAIVAAARQHGLDIPEAINQRVEPGLGVSATVNDRSVIVGQLRFLRENLEVPEEFVQHTKELQARGLTVALVAYGDELAAFGLRDEPREYARQLVADLHALGSEHVQMITGDTKETAAAIAKEVGLDSFRAGLLPHEKNEIVGELASSGKTVMMVGDGVNDAPALASASIGVAMGGLGSDIALNSADVVLMHDRLESIPELIRLGRRTNRIVAANLIFATGVIAVLTIGSLFAELPLPLAVIGHEGSTVIVILNGLRLLRGPLKS